MITFARRHLLAVSTGTIAVLAVVAWLAFGYFGVHTLFIDNEVDEALPTFGEPVADTEQPPDRGTAPEVSSTEPDDPPASTGSTVDEPQITTDAEGSFESLGRYRTVGTALVIGDGSGQRFVRFENFETSNGPDLKVYLVNSSTGDVSDFFDLGNLKGNIGNQNYEIPADVDLTAYDTVMIWCVRFASGFGQAKLVLT